MWQLSCWHCEAVCQFGHAFPIFIFSYCCFKLTGCPGKYGWSALQRLGRSACVPRDSSIQGGQVCTYCAWFFRPGQLRFGPYFDIPMPLSRSLMQFRMGSHSLPAEQGRLARPVVPRHLRQWLRYTCSGRWAALRLKVPTLCAHLSAVQVTVSRC